MAPCYDFKVLTAQAHTDRPLHRHLYESLLTTHGHSVGLLYKSSLLELWLTSRLVDTHGTVVMLGPKDSIIQKNEMGQWTGFSRAKSSFMDDSGTDSESEDEPKTNKKRKYNVVSKVNVFRKKNVKVGFDNGQNASSFKEERDSKQKRKAKGVIGARKVSSVKKELESPVEFDIRPHVQRCTHQDVADKVYGSESGIDANRPLDNKLVKDIEDLVKNGRATVEEFACVLGDHRRSPPSHSSRFLSEMIVHRVKSWKGSHIDISIPIRYFNLVKTLYRLTSLSAELSHPSLLGGSFMYRLVDVLDKQLCHLARNERINDIQLTVEANSENGRGSKQSSVGLQEEIVEDGQLHENGKGEKTCNVPDWVVQSASSCGWWVESSQEAHLAWLFLKMRGLFARVQGSPQDLYRSLRHFMQCSLTHTRDLRPIFALSLLETWPKAVFNGFDGRHSTLRILDGFISDSMLSVICAAAGPRNQLIRNKRRYKEDEVSLDSILKLCSSSTSKTPKSLLYIFIDSLHERHSAESSCDSCIMDSRGNNPLDKGLEKDGFEALELICTWLQTTSEEWNPRELLEEATKIALDRSICIQLRRIAIIAIGAIGTSSMRDSNQVVRNISKLAGQKLEEIEGFAKDYGVNGLSLQSTAKTYLLMLSGNVLKGGNRSSELEWIVNVPSLDRYNLSQQYLTLARTMKAFPCVHVINLKRREDRMVHMKTQAIAGRFLIAGVDAIDGREAVVSPDKVSLQWDTEINSIYDKSCLQRTKVDLTPGERACAASHLGIWQRHVKGELEPFISSKDDVVLILEDDALLGDGFIHNVMSLLENLPKTFDICLLGYRLPKGVEESANQHLSKKGLPKLGTNVKKGKSHLYVRVEFAWELHAYLLSRKGAEKLRGDELLPIFAPADIYVASLMRSKKIQGLICTSQLCTQDTRLVNTPRDVQSIGLKKI